MFICRDDLNCLNTALQGFIVISRPVLEMNWNSAAGSEVRLQMRESSVTGVLYLCRVYAGTINRTSLKHLHPQPKYLRWNSCMEVKMPFTSVHPRFHILHTMSHNSDWKNTQVKDQLPHTFYTNMHVVIKMVFLTLYFFSLDSAWQHVTHHTTEDGTLVQV